MHYNIFVGRGHHGRRRQKKVGGYQEAPDRWHAYFFMKIRYAESLRLELSIGIFGSEGVHLVGGVGFLGPPPNFSLATSTEI